MKFWRSEWAYIIIPITPCTRVRKHISINIASGGCLSAASQSSRASTFSNSSRIFSFSISSSERSYGYLLCPVKYSHTGRINLISSQCPCRAAGAFPGAIPRRYQGCISRPAWSGSICNPPCRRTFQSDPNSKTFLGSAVFSCYWELREAILARFLDTLFPEKRRLRVVHVIFDCQSILKNLVAQDLVRAAPVRAGLF